MTLRALRRFLVCAVLAAAGCVIGTVAATAWCERWSARAWG